MTRVEILKALEEGVERGLIVLLTKDGEFVAPDVLTSSDGPEIALSA